jgi:hypothetical protein
MTYFSLVQTLSQSMSVLRRVDYERIDGSARVVSQQQGIFPLREAKEDEREGSIHERKEMVWRAVCDICGGGAIFAAGARQRIWESRPVIQSQPWGGVLHVLPNERFRDLHG